MAKVTGSRSSCRSRRDLTQRQFEFNLKFSPLTQQRYFRWAACYGLLFVGRLICYFPREAARCGVLDIPRATARCPLIADFEVVQAAEGNQFLLEAIAHILGRDNHAVFAVPKHLSNQPKGIRDSPHDLSHLGFSLS